MEFSLPFRLHVDQEGILTESTSTITRRLSDMRDMYLDDSLRGRSEDPLVYEVFQRDVPALAGELVVCSTVLQPGKVGHEYFMTKGHFHGRRDRGEVYFGLRGTGLVLMQTETDEAYEAVPIGPNEVVYVPPLWGHRTVNTGEEPLVFLAVYPADAGHDYGTIEETGFRCRVIEREGRVVVLPSVARGADVGAAGNVDGASVT